MNWKCRLGFHDWEYIESEGVINLRHKAEGNPGRLRVDGGDLPIKYKRICIRFDCGKFEDTMTPFIEQCRREQAEKESRWKVAQAMMKERS